MVNLQNFDNIQKILLEFPRTTRIEPVAVSLLVYEIFPLLIEYINNKSKQFKRTYRVCEVGNKQGHDGICG
jgi:hypothetical protein